VTKYPLTGTGDSLTRHLAAQQPFHASGLNGLLRLLTKRSKWIIGSIVICVLLALIITANTKPVFEATTTIELNKTSGGSLDLGLDDLMS